MCVVDRGAAGGESVYHARNLRELPFALRNSNFVALVTDSLIRLSRAVSFLLGVIGVTLAATLYLVGAASGVLSIGVGLYAIACAAIVFVLARRSPTLPDG